MSEAEILYIGIGLFVSLLYAEAFGIAPGGIIVPGYLALGVNNLPAVGLTLAVGLLTFFVVRVLANVTILYGRRRIALMILVAFLSGSLLRAALGFETPIGPFETEVIGYIVPGLIAIWIDRQGVVVTLSSAVTAGILTRLTALLMLGL